MSTTDTVTISLPAELADQVDRLAGQEGRLRSERFRGAFQQYADRRRRQNQPFAPGEARAALSHLTVEQITGPERGRRRSRRSTAH